MIKIQASRKSK